jgi:hypothetical protein
VRIKRKRETDKEWTDNTQSSPCAHLIHRITGVEGCFDLKLPHGEDQPLPPTGSKCKIVITGLKKANKYDVVCVPQKTYQEEI